ncbi:MAG: hypothetical protein RJA70_1607 [Pseudomonadota bacterium]|jgi:hypothetical protein
MRRTAGFTLVELMVSLSGALFLSIAVFMFAKHTSALYQQELRAANASVTGIIGFERLRADLARAGFLASPNVRRDPFVCGSPVTDAAWPTRLRNLSSVMVEDIPTGELPALFAANALAPQRVVLAGNYSSSEAFPIRAVAAAGGAFQIYLQVESGPMARLGYSEVDVDQAALLTTVFPPGRAVRLVDKSGRHHYGTISSVAGGDTPIVTLEGAAPALIFRSESGIGCGLRGEETGAVMNTVNFIRYDLRNLSDDDRYRPVYNSASAPEGEVDRTELVREELLPTGALVPNSTELVSEYAVDLRFRLTVAPSSGSALQYVPQATVEDWAGLPDSLGAGRGPQLIRSVHTWLSVRSREPDRASTIAAPAGPLFRVGLGASGGAPFARVRTVQARVALHNQMGVTWQ